MIHYLSSPLYRQNGIVEFIRAYIDLQGGQVWCDHLPAAPRYLTPTVILDGQYNYTPEVGVCSFTGEAIPSLQWPDDLVGVFENHARSVSTNTVIYTHCAVSALGVYRAGRKQVFVQHESDIYYPNNRMSYMSDEWLARHRGVMKSVTIGATMPTTPTMAFDRAMPTPYPIVFEKREKTEHLGDIVAFFDGSYRKGWDRYLRWWEANKKPDTTVITHSPRTNWPAEWKVRSIDAHNDKLQTIRNFNRAFVPSRSEVTCLALLECISQVPTYTFCDDWTEPYVGRVTRVPHYCFEPKKVFKSMG